ncbi:hypothetical protein RchiOBHm_Chr5g0049811 [Rosa chinensis]|uniref:Uncharacterized protein n=1 Tax=Rosa chinensis TaxID=74649 RepID=A0A2P6QEX9_ROSCH|nr:hypothetical protein RchiOBHm_Chr5g0049811 [Rosa chinensis]
MKVVEGVKPSACICGRRTELLLDDGTRMRDCRICTVTVSVTVISVALMRLIWGAGWLQEHKDDLIEK